MDYDKSKVYTVMTADEVKVGSKGYYADCLKDMEERVNSDDKKHYGTVAIINPSSETYRFNMEKDSASYALFYLVEEPKEERFRSYKDTEEMVDHFYRHFNLIPQEYSLPRIWVKGKPEDRYKDKILEVIGFYKNSNTVVVGLSCEVINEFTLYELFTHFTYLDGSPCGVKGEE